MSNFLTFAWWYVAAIYLHLGADLGFKCNAPSPHHTVHTNNSPYSHDNNPYFELFVFYRNAYICL